MAEWTERCYVSGWRLEPGAQSRAQGEAMSERNEEGFLHSVLGIFGILSPLCQGYNVSDYRCWNSESWSGDWVQHGEDMEAAILPVNGGIGSRG